MGTGGNTGDLITLTGASPGKIHRITDIMVSAAGTLTAFNVQITKNDGTTVITQIGGQVSSGAYFGPFDFNTPVNCAVNDNPKIIFTCTGATGGTIAISANYIFATI